MGGRGLRYVRWAKRFLTFAELPEEPRFRRSYTLYDPPELAALLSPDLAGHVADVVAEHREIYNDNTLTDEVNRMCLADTRLFLPGLNLAYSDRSSMAASVEVRTPFVDPVVARAAFSIPGRQKIVGRQAKVALKQAAENWLPKEIVHRPKASFSAPLRAWVRNDLPDVIRDVLVSGELVDTGFLRRRRAAPAHRRRPGRPPGQLEADLAAALAGAVVPQRTSQRRVGVTRTTVSTLNKHQPEDGMKQIAQNYKSGELTVLDVPAPGCRAGGVLVRSLFSLISTGTEMMKVTEAKMSMVGQARARPDQVRKVLDSVAQQGALSHLQEGDEPARLLHPARLLAVRRGDRGRPRRRGVQRRPAGRRPLAERVFKIPGHPHREPAVRRGPAAALELTEPRERRTHRRDRRRDRHQSAQLETGQRRDLGGQRGRLGRGDPPPYRAPHPD